MSMIDHYLQRADASLAKGDVKGVLRALETALSYSAAQYPESLQRVEEMAQAVAIRGDEKRGKQAEALIERARTLAAAAERIRQEGQDAAEAVKRVEEEQYRNAARERLETLNASRGTRDITSPRSFEYAVMELGRSEAADYLNKAGSLGWELVNAIPASDGRHILYMKRDVWLAAEASSGRLTASAVPMATAGAAAAGGMAFAGFYYESGPDFDADGDVDGGLFDNIQNVFG